MNNSWAGWMNGDEKVEKERRKKEIDGIPPQTT
jgi:hypothetical protein